MRRFQLVVMLGGGAVTRHDPIRPEDVATLRRTIERAQDRLCVGLYEDAVMTEWVHGRLSRVWRITTFLQDMDSFLEGMLLDPDTLDLRAIEMDMDTLIVRVI